MSTKELTKDITDTDTASERGRVLVVHNDDVHSFYYVDNDDSVKFVGALFNIDFYNISTEY